MKKIVVLAFMAVTSLQLYAQQFMPIWPEGKKPNFNGKVIKDSITNRVWQVGTPGFYPFVVQPEENAGTAVLICPGGGYERLAYLQSGLTLAKWYNTHGISAFVLNYRLPDQIDLADRKTAPLQDAQRAMKVIRANASKWSIQTDTTKKEIEKYSNELHVNANVPPTFIVHAYDDPAVNVRNSLMFYNALVENNVNASIHIFPQGGHGIRLHDNPGSTDDWTNLLLLWLKE